MTKELYTFTFGAGQPNAGGCVQIRASSFTRALNEMTRLHGDFWSHSYGETAWKATIENCRKNGVHYEQPICPTIELLDGEEIQPGLTADDLCDQIFND